MLRLAAVVTELGGACAVVVRCKIWAGQQLRSAKTACAIGPANTLSPSMKMRRCTGISVLIAFLTTLMLASAPRLHDQLHPTGAKHECAATILASGKCEHSLPPQAAPKLESAPNARAFLPERLQAVIAAVPSSIQEHAPPTSR